VVGPGLSRDDAMIETARQVMLEAKKEDIWMVIDAVGLNKGMAVVLSL